MPRKDKSPSPANQASPRQAPFPDQPIGGRLHGSGTEMEVTYDGLYDISNVDQQEGNMNNGVTGGFYEEEEEGFSPIY
jgi:hypothetical protein